jgi:hypothetical protein
MRCFRLGSVLAPAMVMCLLLGDTAAQQKGNLVTPESSCGLEFYAQGGVVVEGVAYFTANDEFYTPGLSMTDDFPRVVAFDVRSFRKLRTYKFAATYDSAPLVFPTKDGTWLVIAHEWRHARTVAMNRDTGEVVWTSAANQTGMRFFGYSYYLCMDGSRLILAANENGLHAISGETGKDVWSVSGTSAGAVTPAVDQANKWVFYQSKGLVHKIDATDGSVLKSVSVTNPTTSNVWNTVLTKDSHGSFVATHWYDVPGNRRRQGAIRVYDEDLNLKWQKTGLPTGRKHTLTYADGKLLTGCGDGWDTYSGDSWKHIDAYNIADGTLAWKCDLSKYNFQCIQNVPYFNGFFYAQTDDDHDKYPSSFMFRINASTGKLDEVFDYGYTVNTCAACCIAAGKVFKGTLWADRCVVVEIATGSNLDWPGPYGDPQLNQMAVSDPRAKIVPMRAVGQTPLPKPVQSR